jgi:hypothetical protein
LSRQPPTGRFVAPGCFICIDACLRAETTIEVTLACYIRGVCGLSFEVARGRPVRSRRHLGVLGEGTDGNIRKATGRGDAYRLWVRGILRGVFAHVGKARIFRSSLRRGWRGWKVGNRVNPRTGCGMQQAREARCGASRRGAERARGRNVSRRVAPSARTGLSLAAAPGSGRASWRRWRDDP